MVSFSVSNARCCLFKRACGKIDKSVFYVHNILSTEMKYLRVILLKCHQFPSCMQNNVTILTVSENHVGWTFQYIFQT